MPPRPTAIALLLAATMLGGAKMLRAQELPVTHGNTLSGRAVTLPVPGHAETLLIVGFSKASSDKVRAWWLQAKSLCRAHSAVACYEAAVIEDAPSFVRGMIVGGMKRDMSPDRRDTFLTITENEKAWKQAFGFSAPDDAYLAIFDNTGKLLWRASGGANSANAAAIEKGFESICK